MVFICLWCSSNGSAPQESCKKVIIDLERTCRNFFVSANEDMDGSQASERQAKVVGCAWEWQEKVNVYSEKGKTALVVMLEKTKTMLVVVLEKGESEWEIWSNRWEMESPMSLRMEEWVLRRWEEFRRTGSSVSLRGEADAYVARCCNHLQHQRETWLCCCRTPRWSVVGRDFFLRSEGWNVFWKQQDEIR